MRDKFWELTDKTRLGSLLKINNQSEKLENSNAPGLGQKLLASKPLDSAEEVDYKTDS